MGAEYWPPTFLVSFFLFFAFSFLHLSSTINTIQLLLHLTFLLHLTISSPKKKNTFLNFSTFLHSSPLIFFLDPCVFEHFCYTPIFGKTPFSNPSFLASKCHLLPIDPLFLLLMARNINHHLNVMMRRGSFKTPRPMLQILTWTSR